MGKGMCSASEAQGKKEVFVVGWRNLKALTY
jgi:hypothetical protein